ncbi:DUF637 domain-containing protein, partial [Pseudomonas sp. 6D_7.1_Bac1]|uniref:DUF637 domain-containing protein n=1 Tax=Pseudomonas sp. 6D_7.1_Bac1 TaxID=2971615 RepID=UPI0021C711EE
VVQNSGDGLIYSQNGDLQLSAASLANAKGTVQSLGSSTLTVSGDIDNQSGRLLAQSGDLTVSAANLDNRGGTLASVKGALEARIVGVLKNGYDLSNNRQGGIVQAQRLNLSAWGGIDNYGGRIAAQTGDAIVSTGNFDNRNGGLYAKGRVSVTGNNFDNSGDNDGQIAGNQIDLNLTGALNNRLGIIESDSTLSVRAASLDNQTGQLRALGSSGQTNFQIGGLFDNRNGKLETANSDLTLNAGGFLNQGGSLLHVGTGTFDIATANVTGAGGSIVTRGGLTLSADTLTNSSVIQAGRLTVNVNNLNQTGSGQLLASTSLVGNGVNWNNDGLIASDGTASLALGGNYGGNGRYSSLGNLGLTAASMTLGGAGSVASGGDATVYVGGQLNNYGRLTSAAGMTVTAGGINNYGTLGSSGNLRLSASSLLNQNGLIFSGGDMALRTNVFTNRYADVYSLGNLSIARDDGNGLSSSINNISATLESGGDMSLAADHIENRKDVFQTTGGGMVSGYIGVKCYACAEFVPYVGYQEDGYFVWVENYKSQIVQDSASASMTAGRNFLASGREFLNQSSTVSAGNNATLNLQTFTNQGASVGDYSVRRSFDLPNDVKGNMGIWVSVMNYNSANDPSYYNQYQRPSLHAWSTDNVESMLPIISKPGGRGDNPYTSFGIVHISDSPDPRWLTNAHYNIDAPRAEAPDTVKNAAFTENTLIESGPSTFASAIVQAGGAVNINASQNLTNSVVRGGVALGGGASRVGSTQLSGQAAPTVVTFNAQLPPNLAQQQVNPITLPGFTLPTGQNGLFRLSGQGTSAAVATTTGGGPQSWTMGSASVSTAQRQQSLPDVQARSVQIGDIAQVASSDRQLTRITRQATDSNVSASAINVSAPADNAGSTLLLPGHEGNAGAITQVGAVHVDGASQSAVATGPDLSLPTLPLNPRDPLASVTSPVAAPLVPPVNTQAPGALISAPIAVPGVVTAPTVSIPLVSNPAIATPVTRIPAVVSPLISTPNVNVSVVPPSVIGTPAASQTVARVQGLPDTSFKANPQKYLIETNPVLTDLKQFMSSDYLLANLGYDPDKSAKRLGDGLYEQKLIQQAVVARTGQRFIDGQTSDEKLFKYLMNNAIASKNELNLSLGVSLTSEQVAALTHDIVWMESAVVNGEQVLVPVLYLANANNRLAANGALIQGSDVNLIAGKDLDNAGTLRASNNLLATAGNDLVNSGLVEAGNRLDLLAGNNIVNKAGGIIAGRDVSLTAINGDVVNERTITTAKASDGYTSTSKDYANSAARIEAANDLSLQAGRDVNNTGGVLQSGRDTRINAGRDVNLLSAQVDSKLAGGSSFLDEKIVQLTGSINSGRDVSVSAGRDISAIASQIDAKRDIAMSATENLTLASAADETHFYSKDRHVTEQRDHVSQVATTLNAGGNVALSAGKDMTLISSRISAGDEAYLVAGGKLDVLAAQDSDYSLYDKKEKGGWGSSQTQRDEVTKVTNVGSEIKTGGDLTLVSGGDQKYQVAKLESGKDLTLQSGGAITFEGVKDLKKESHEKSDNDLAWTSMEGKGNTDETLRQSKLVAKGNLVIKAVDGLKIDVKQIDQNTVSQTIDAMVKADPQLAWLKDAEKRGDVDWRQVKEMHDSFQYSHSGLGQGAMLAIIIIVTVLTAGAASAAVGAATSASAGTTMAAATAEVAATATTAAVDATAAGLGNVIASAALTSMASTGVVSVINNKGNIGAAFKDTFSSDSLKNAAIAGFTAGAMNYADSNWFQSPSGATNGGSQVTSAGPIQNPGYSSDMLSWSNAEQTVLRSSTHALINSGISTAINGGSFGQNLGGALVGEGLDLAAAAGNKGVGDLAQELKVDPGTAQAILFHAVLGGLISSAKGEGFTSGAIAGGVAEGLTPKANEFLAQYVSEHFNANDLSLQGSQDKIATAQIIGLLSAALAGGNANTGSLIGGAGEKYNSELHKNQIKETDYELRKEIGEYIPQQEQDSLGKIEPIEIMQGPHGGASPLGTSLLGSGKLPVVGGSGTSGNVATE